MKEKKLKMNNTQEITTNVKVGDIVLSKTLKIKRIVTRVNTDIGFVTLKNVKRGFHSSFFESLSLDFNKRMSFDELALFYYLYNTEKMEPIIFTPQEVASVEFRNGDELKHIDLGERVIIDTFEEEETTNGKEVYYNLISLDKLLDNEFLKYRVTKEYLRFNFEKLNKEVVLNKDVSFSF